MICEPKGLGGTVKTSALGFSAESTIQMIGTRNSRATSDSSVWEMAVRSRAPQGRRWIAGTGAEMTGPGAWIPATLEISLVIVHPPLLPDELEDRDDQDDHEQHPRDRRGEAELLELEALFVQIDHHRRGGVARTAAGQHVRLGEDLERRDQGEHDGEEDGRRDQRQHDLEEPLGRACPV